jgi:hypothetical protein
MISAELLPLLLKVISSWQVIVVTIAVILYFSLVSFVARASRSQYGASIHSGVKSSLKKKKNKSTPAVVETTEEDTNDELGLEER